MFSFTHPISPVVIALSPNKTKIFPRYRKRSPRWPLPFPLNAAENLRRRRRSGWRQVQSLTRGLKLLEWIAESHSSVALTELAQQAGLPTPPLTAC
jgi:IclR family acetate operon transcriptional repressor